jgi:glycosyltransferase involved in cell wall biosynthesis
MRNNAQLGICAEEDVQFEVSVILPTCNRPEMCLDAVYSLLRQTHLSYEVIVVDNSFDTKTADELQQSHAIASSTVPIRYIREQRRGLVFARHTGAVLARGRYLAFADDDAFFDPNWVEELANTFSLFSDAVAVGTRIDILWDKTPDPHAIPYEPLLGLLDYGPRRICSTGLFINGGSMAVRREVLWEFGGFNPGQCGDYLLGDSETGLCRKLHKAGRKIAWTPETAMHHRQFVDRHGTQADLCRRAWNNGIADAYDSWRQGGHVHELINGIIAFGSSCLSLSRRRRKNDESFFDRRVIHSQVSARLWYYFRFRLDVALRRRVTELATQLNSEYVINGSAVMLNNSLLRDPERVCPDAHTN